MKIVILAVAFVAAVCSERETHRLIRVQYGVDTAQDIVHDKDDNTVTITVSQAPGLKQLIPTINFHDFNTKFVVFKHVESGNCFLARAPIPFATPEMYRMKRTNLTLGYTAEFDMRPLTQNEVETIAGKKIADFCQDYTTLRMFLTPEPQGEYKRAEEESLAPCWFNCGDCRVSVPSSTGQVEDELNGQPVVG